MVYTCVMIFSDLLVNKPISMYFGYTTAATLLFPMWFVLNDIIAEVYGYKVCRRILLTGFITQLVFNLICNFMINLPSPSDWHDQAAFDLVLGHLLRIALATFAAFIISGFINIRLLTKWKILMSGKHFVLRSIGSSAIGEGLYSVLNVWVILLGSTPVEKIFSIIFWSYFIKLTYTIVLAYPAALVVQLIKRIDGIDVDEDISFFLNKNNKAFGNQSS